MKTITGILIAAFLLLTPSLTRAAEKETAFERIIRTNTLRCGYAVAPPWFMVDPSTKAMSGVSYDMTNAVAQKINVKIDWVEETGWGVAEAGIIAGRYDMLCGNVCIDPARARSVYFSTPFLHNPIYAVVRKDDTRFDKSLEGANAQGIKVGVKNGHVFEFTAKDKFPKADFVYANDISDDSDFFLMLTSKKIDVAFTGAVETVDRYLKTNPGSVKIVGEPVRWCNAAFMLPQGDERLKNLIDTTITELNTSGVIHGILKRWIKDDPKYVRTPAMPFRE